MSFSTLTRFDVVCSTGRLLQYPALFNRSDPRTAYHWYPEIIQLQTRPISETDSERSVQCV